MKKNLQISDSVKIVNDWLPKEVNNVSRAKIIGFQKNGGRDYAKIHWANPEYVKEFGNLFPLDEVRKV